MYNELKNQLILEKFNGATSVSVEQKFYINLLSPTSTTERQLSKMIFSKRDPFDLL